MDSVGKEECKKIFEAKIWPALLAESASTPQNEPLAYVLGGQPGAGKSQLTKDLQATVFVKNPALEINGDEFRASHPRFKQLLETHGRDASKYTGSFSATMTEMALNRAISERRNIIIEGTFRTDDIPLRTLQGLKKEGYATGVAIKTCSSDLSLASTVERYERAVAAGLPARQTPKEHHDFVVSKLAINADSVFRSGLADSFVVYSREALIYEKDKSAGLPSAPIQSTLNNVNARESLRETGDKVFLQNFNALQDDPRYAKHSLKELTSAAYFRGISEAMANEKGEPFDQQKYDNVMATRTTAARLPEVEDPAVNAVAKSAAKEFNAQRNDGHSL